MDSNSPDSTEGSPESQANVQPSGPSTPYGGQVSEKHLVRRLFNESPASSSRPTIPIGEEVGSFQRFLDRSLNAGNFSSSDSRGPSASVTSSPATSFQQNRVNPLQIRLADLIRDSPIEIEDEDDEELEEEQNEEDMDPEHEVLDGEETERPFDIMEVEGDQEEAYEGEMGEEEFDEDEEAFDPAEFQHPPNYGGNYYSSNPSYPFYQPRMLKNTSAGAMNVPFQGRPGLSSSSLVSSSQTGRGGIKLHIRRTAPEVHPQPSSSRAMHLSSAMQMTTTVGTEDDESPSSDDDSEVLHMPGGIEISPVKRAAHMTASGTSKTLLPAQKSLRGIVDTIRESKLKSEPAPPLPRTIPQQMLEKIRKLQNVELIEIDDQSDPEEVEAEVVQPKRKKASTKSQNNISPTSSDVLPSTSDIILDQPPVVTEKRKRGRPRGSKSEGGPARRTERKRKPTKQFATELKVPRFKIRKGAVSVGTSAETNVGSDSQVADSTTDGSQDQNMLTLENADDENRLFIETSSEVKSLKSSRGRTRGRPSTGKPRGRPRGSTLKNRMEREAAAASVASIVEAVLNQSGGIEETATADGEANATDEQPSTTTPTPTIPRARKPRGSGTLRGSARGARAARGSRGSRQPRTPKVPKVPKERKPKLPKAISPPKPPLQVFEEETRMSATAEIKAPANSSIEKSLAPPDADESTQASISSTSTSLTGAAKLKKFSKDLIEERKPVTAETLFEYRWPNEDGAEQYMLQEQVSEYLGVKSFKRKYPDLLRRVVDMEERNFLREKQIVSETQCDLGLTALSSADVLDIMYGDFPEKYEEFRKVIQDRQEQELLESKLATTPSAAPVRDRSAEFMRRIIRSSAKWNAKLNKERTEQRSNSFDLQTLKLHIQKSRMKYVPPEATKVGYYPLTILGGQYCDNYKRYTPTELKYLPLGTVCYGPLTNQENPSALDSEESQSDSDDSSSSSSSSSSSDEDEPDTVEPKCSTNSDEVSDPNDLNAISTAAPDEKVANGAPKSPPAEIYGVCKSCDGDKFKNKNGNPEVLLHCTKCDVPNHPSCLELSLDMLPFIKKYNWQCTDCKNCIECNDPADEDKMLFCDLCDRGYHIYCVGLRKVPTGRWHCRVCSFCHSCEASEPSPDDRAAEWHHEFKKGDKGAKHFMHSLCVACHKLYKKGQFCPTCLKCHKADDKAVHECRSCEKKVHRDCVKRPLQSMFGFMCDPCDAAFRSKTKIPTHLN